MTEEELVKILQDEIDKSEVDLIEHANERALALDYYNSVGRAIEKEEGEICEGRSKLTSNDVGDTVDNCLAQMMPSFGDMAAVFEPISEEDEQSASDESKVVSYYLMDKNRGFNIIRDALFDALLEKNCALKTSWQEDELVDNRRFKELDLMQLQRRVMEALNDENQEIVDFSESEKGYELEIRTSIVTAYPKVITFAPEDLRVNSDHDSSSVVNARFVCHRPANVTESDLIAAGYSAAVVHDLPDYVWNDDAAAQARNATQSMQQSNESSKGNRVLDYHEIYHFVDFDGDGIAERRKIIMVGNVILDNEEVTHCSIITGSTMPVPHQFWGMSMYDKVHTIQDSKTVLLRQVVDHTAMSINNRLSVISDQILEPDELKTSTPNGIIQVASQDAIRELLIPPLDQSVMSLMGQLDKMRTERAGAALDMTAENIPIGANATAHGTERIITSMEQMQAAMTTAIAEQVIRELYLQFHELLRKHATGDISIKVGNKYLKSDPRDWPSRDKINVQVGVSAGERVRKARAMQTVVTNQLMMLQLGGGGTMLNQRGMYKANTDLGAFQGLDFPEQYYLDPESEEAIKNSQAQAQQAEQSQQRADQKEQMMMQLQMFFEKQKQETKRLEQKQKDDQFYDNLALEYDKLTSEQTISFTEIEAETGQDVPGSVI